MSDEIERRVREKQAQSRKPSILDKWKAYQQQQVERERSERERQIQIANENFAKERALTPLFEKFAPHLGNYHGRSSPWHQMLRLEKTNGEIRFWVYDIAKDYRTRASFPHGDFPRKKYFAVTINQANGRYNINECIYGQSDIGGDHESRIIREWSPLLVKENITLSEALDFLKDQLANHVVNAEIGRNKFLIKAGIIIAFVFAAAKCSAAGAEIPKSIENTQENQKIEMTVPAANPGPEQ